jgi:hypothetical protein
MNKGFGKTFGYCSIEHGLEKLGIGENMRIGALSGKMQSTTGVSGSGYGTMKNRIFGEGQS